MNERLDNELAALRSEPPSGRYAAINARVFEGIEAARRARQATPTVYAMRVAAVCGALTLGVAAGGATAVAVAREAPEVSVFSVNSQLAPSTLLDHHE